MSVSVLILTKNEEGDLPGCLDSVAWSDDVHVLDSGSTDRTLEIARERGAIVRHRDFDGYSKQRNAGLHETEFKNPWVLILDADERIPAELRDEMIAFVKSPPPGVVSCSIRRRDFFMGKWLKHAQMSPFYQRLVMPNKVRYEREINEVLVPDGEVHTMAHPFDHHPFSKGIGHWVHKHNVYSSMEAAELVKERNAAKPDLREALFGRDFHSKRRAQKAFFYRMPARPLVKWTYLMVARRAVLDGPPGWEYARLMAIYEHLIDIKAKEIELGGV